MLKKYHRILLKVSGEFLGSDSKIHDTKCIDYFCKELLPLYKSGIELLIVVGGGNICRGRDYVNSPISRTTADQIGMLATIINGLALKEILKVHNVPSVVLSSIAVPGLCSTYSIEAAENAIRKKEVVICVGGTANPFVSTDTSAVIRAAEVSCDIMLKCTQVGGVFSDDPTTNCNSVKYDKLTYHDVLDKRLKVIDLPAICIAMEQGLKIGVLSINKPGNLAGVVSGGGEYTIIY